MKIRIRKHKKATRLEDFRFGLPAWNGLVCYCYTKNEENIKYTKLMKNMSKVYIYTTEFSEEQQDEYKMSSCILCGVGYKLAPGVLLADALTDDKEVYFVPWKNVACWGRVKFVGCKDKYGAYEELDKIVKMFSVSPKMIRNKEFVKIVSLEE